MSCNAFCSLVNQHFGSIFHFYRIYLHINCVVIVGVCALKCVFFDWLSFLLFDWYHFVQTNTQTENKLVSWIIVSTMGALTPIFLRQKVCILRIVFNHFMVTMIVCTLHRSFPSLSSFSSLYRSHFKSKANTDFQYKVFQCNRIVNILFWNKLNCVCELLVKRRSDKWIWSDVRVGICFLREFSSNII